MPDQWKALDRGAQINLNGLDLLEFHRYKKQLQAEGHEWKNDAEAILTGWIWDAMEAYNNA